MLTKNLSSHIRHGLLRSLGIRARRDYGMRKPLSKLALGSPSGATNTIRVAYRVATSLSLRSIVLGPLIIIGQISPTFINGGTHNLTGGFGMVVSSLVTAIILVHDH